MVPEFLPARPLNSLPNLLVFQSANYSKKAVLYLHPARRALIDLTMLDAMSLLLSSLARRLGLLRRNRRITSSPVIPRSVPFFSCGGGGDSLSPFVKAKSTLRKVKGALSVGASSSKRIVEHGQDYDRGGGGKVDADEPCVWRRTILLGQRCQPLEFNGAIHYDSEGQRLWQPRTTPLSPLLLSPARSLGFGYPDRA